jgi:hypothetical protein
MRTANRKEIESMKMRMVFIAMVATSGIFVAQSMAQMQAPPAIGQKPPTPGVERPALGSEKTIEGQVKSVDPSEREITLMDGTTLGVSPGAALKSGVLREGTTVIASYREEQGQNVLTTLMVADPSTPPPASEPKPPRSPSSPRPGDSPKRYY